MNRTEASPEQIQAVLLDLGGVLIRIHFQRTLAHWSEAAGLPRDALAHRFDSDEAYAHHETGALRFSDFATHIRRTLGVDLDDDTLLDGWNLVLGDAMPGATELVAAIAARHPLFLFSNSNAAHYARWSSDQAALLREFRQVFVSHELGMRKPDPQAFSQVVSRIGAAPGRVVFFDDLEENVHGARHAGLVAHRVDGPADVARILGIAFSG